MMFTTYRSGFHSCHSDETHVTCTSLLRTIVDSAMTPDVWDELLHLREDRKKMLEPRQGWHFPMEFLGFLVIGWSSN